VLEWDPIQLATADLISLALYRNGQKAGNIPKPLSMHTTKISGLAVDTEYTFHLVLRTTAGTYASPRVTVRTHKLTDLSGITLTCGIMPAAVRERVAAAVERIGAKIVDGVRIDTTHFVTTEGRGVLWERANELNIPVVRPEWVEACENSGRILGVTKFYLDAARVGIPYEEKPPAATPAPAPPPKDVPPKDSSPQQTHAKRPSIPPAQASSTAEQKEEGGKEEPASSESEKSQEGEKARIGAEAEAKPFAEEKGEQKLVTRPKPTVEDAEEGGKEATSGSDEKGAKSPSGDGFQDVAL
jgi:hypothetical protein